MITLYHVPVSRNCHCRWDPVCGVVTQDCTHIGTQIHTYTVLYMYVHPHMHVHTCTRTHSHITYVRMYVHLHTHKDVNAHLQPPIHNSSKSTKCYQCTLQQETHHCTCALLQHYGCTYTPHTPHRSTYSSTVRQGRHHL